MLPASSIYFTFALIKQSWFILDGFIAALSARTNLPATEKAASLLDDVAVMALMI